MFRKIVALHLNRCWNLGQLTCRHDWQQTYGDFCSTGDFGWGGAFGTYFWVDPQEDLVVVFMAAAPGYIGQVLRVLVKNLVVASIID
jgi:CubicO group peptidase (beta-lactamase class C family)